MGETRAENVGTRVVRDEAKRVICCYRPYSTPINLFMAETTYIPLSCVSAFNRALLYKVFQHRNASST
jgi:hypothetical protein